MKNGPQRFGGDGNRVLIKGGGDFDESLQTWPSGNGNATSPSCLFPPCVNSEPDEPCLFLVFLFLPLSFALASHLYEVKNGQSLLRRGAGAPCVCTSSHFFSIFLFESLVRVSVRFTCTSFVVARWIDFSGMLNSFQPLLLYISEQSADF